MLLDLTNLEDFRYSMNKREHAYVENGILYMTRGVSFEKLMITCAYKAKGNCCCYCGRKFSKNVTKTIDHIYPESFGGVTIINNLVPACSECNEEKSNLTMNEYLKWKKISDLDEKERYRYRCIGNHEKEMLKRGTILPKEWFETRKIKIFTDIDCDNKIKTKRRDQAKRFLWKYGVFEQPVVMSDNQYLLDGFLTLWVAKEEGIGRIPVIKCQNLILLK